MRTGPVNAPANGAPTEPRRGRQHVRWRDLGHFLTTDIHEFTVAFATTREIQGRIRPQTEANENLDQLILEIIGSDEHRSRASGCQFTITCQQPPPLVAGLLREHTIFRSRFEKDAVESKEPQPPRQ